MSNFVESEIIVIGLLVVISLVAIAIRHSRIPYTVALVIVGLGLSLVRVSEITLTPELILALFLPPLVFEAAFHLSLSELQRNLPRILVLAIPGVIITTLIVGVLLTSIPAISFPIALTFGALISATDPIAIIALFRTLGVPKRLSVLVEAESLLNDGTAIVIFNLTLGIALTGQLDIGAGVLDFARVVVGGLAIGVALGWITAQLIARVDDHLVETTLTTALAFSAYLLAEELHFSGVLAVVAAGLLCGNLGAKGMSPTTRIILSNFWEYIAFLVNSLVFLLIGLQVDISRLLSDWQPIALAIVAVMFARIIVIYGLGQIVNRWIEPVPMRWQHILSWGGLRGAVGLALALSLPKALGADRELLITMAFGVVLFTLFVQGMTIGPLVRRLGIVSRSAAQTEYQLNQARLVTIQAAVAHLDTLRKQGVISVKAWSQLNSTLAQQITDVTETVHAVLLKNPELAEQDMALGKSEVLRAQRSALLSLRREGTIADDVFETLAVEIDAALSNHRPML